MMMRAVVLAFAILGSAFGAEESEMAGVRKERPVTKVVNLLKDMLKQLEKEAAEDEDIYNKMACWCETTDKEKNKAIADATARIAALNTEISTLTQASARLNTEIKHFTIEVADNQAALDQADEMRQKQLAEFNQNEKDMLIAINQLKSAVQTLSEQHPGSFVQVAAALNNGLTKHWYLLESVLTPSEREAAQAFLQAPGFNSEPTFKQSYAPQSGAIFGILKQMKETFEENLAKAQKDEVQDQKDFEQLKAAKEEEIAEGQAQIDTKTSELAETDEKLAQAKQDIKDTTNSLAADEAFLSDLKEKCQTEDKDYAERTKTRSLEMEACSKCLAVLSSDEAHDLFSRTFSFIQQTSAITLSSQRRSKASEALSAAAKKFNSPRLAALAVRVRLNAFTEVKKAIDDLVAALLKEKADEIKKKDYCVAEFNTNQLQTEKKTKEKKDLIAHIKELDFTIEDLTKAIDTLKAEIADMNEQLKRAGEDREKANKEFQITISDARETQKMLKAALDILSEFYGIQMLQQPASAPELKKNAGGAKVTTMLETIIADAKDMEAEAQRAEEEGQAAYENYVKETQASVEEKNKDIGNKSETKAKTEEELIETKEAKEAALIELENLSNFVLELHQECDFVVKNFDMRQAARDDEVEALRQAKNILSGAAFEQFLQTA
jgi:hypothetical protein